MWRCPVCGNGPMQRLVCDSCGFELSCDFEQYSTICSTLPGNAKPISARRTEWKEKNQNMKLSSAKDFLTNSDGKSGLIITKYVGSGSETVNIPPIINGRTITAIGKYAFSNAAVKSVIIPDGVTSIGEYAFTNCRSLKNVTLPVNLVSIGQNAFIYCESLTDIKIPDSVASIGAYAFGMCASLVSVVLPDGLTALKNLVFQGCTGLSSVKLPDKLLSIGASPFGKCSNLKSLTIPDSVKSINSFAFIGRDDLTLYVSRGSYAEQWAGKNGVAFQLLKAQPSQTPQDAPEKYFLTESDGKGGLIITLYMGDSSEDVNIPPTINGLPITAIGNYAFVRAKMKSVVVSNGVKSIGKHSFFLCSRLNDIRIPNSVTSIGEFAFNGCGNLTLYAPRGSYAEQWAGKNGVAYQTR